MKDLTWDASLSVDIQEIDDDHRRLFDLYNILNQSVKDGDSASYIEAVMEELITCTIWHFRHEERLMLKYEYNDFSAHKAEHQDLIESARELQQNLLQEGKPVSSKDIEFLERWLVVHILGADMDLGFYLGEAM
ncbi:MAG: hemerythrin family protein [Gammaproteobacteria bacterium]|nr:hemerythrin family protein [Gammaproteobacteria bacterium]